LLTTQKCLLRVDYSEFITETFVERRNSLNYLVTIRSSRSIEP